MIAQDEVWCPTCEATMVIAHGARCPTCGSVVDPDVGGWAGPWPHDEQEDTGAEA